MSRTFASSTSLPDLPLWQKMLTNQDLISFTLEVTARCNNNCRHCYINLPAAQEEARARELTLEEIREIAKEASSLGALWCLITGGEPLLRDDFFELYLMLKRAGLLVSVFTNACLVTPEHVALFKKYPPRDLEVSVYGVTQPTYEAVTRQPGSFSQFQQGLARLLNSGVRVILKAMALRANVHELPAIAHFCRERSWRPFRFDPFLHLRFDGNPRRNEEIRAQRLSPAEIVAIEKEDPERRMALRNFCDRMIGPPCNPGCAHLFHCGAGVGGFTVSFDGIFRLCAPLWHPGCTADLRTGSLRELWRNLVPQVRQMNSPNREFWDKCRSCSISAFCQWCPAHAYLETGRMDAWVEDFCRVAFARAQMGQGKIVENPKLL